MTNFKDLARQSGATASDGSRAENVFCFTEAELRDFYVAVITDCSTTLMQKTLDHNTK